jgi:hypothetical protein
MRARSLLLIAAGSAVARQSAADPPALVSTDTFAPSSRCDTAVDAGVLVGFPAALPTGLSRGLVAGVTIGDTFTFGARVGWVTATESTMAWNVTHTDLRLRATGGLQHAIGRGTIGVRLGVGGTLVHESRRRAQGERAGLEGDDLATSVYALLPAADLDAVVQLGIAGPWRIVVSGGPSIAIDGGAHASWTAQLGVAWQP